MTSNQHNPVLSKDGVKNIFVKLLIFFNVKSKKCINMKIVIKIPSLSIYICGEGRLNK